MSRFARIALAMLVALPSAACAVGTDFDWTAEEGSNDGDAIASTQDAIINGGSQPNNQYSAVAIYTRLTEGQYAGYLSKGSGRVLNPHSGYSLILTCRHCITVDAEPASDVADKADIYVTGHPSPGYELVDPPSMTVNAAYVMPYPGPNPKDLALLYVEGDLQLPSADRYMVGLSARDPSWLANTSDWSNVIYHVGYGITDWDDGATFGTVRGAGGFWVSMNVLGTAYMYPNSGWWNTAIAGGDSGGIGMRRYLDTYYQVGVIAQGGEGSNGVDYTVADAWGWLMDNLGGTYLRTQAYPDRRVTHGTTAKKQLVETRANRDDTWQDMIVYDRSSKVIRARTRNGTSDMCVDLKWNRVEVGQPFWWWPCSEGSAQRLIVNRYNMLELEGHPNYCLREEADGDLVLARCSPDADQTWVFDYDPGEF